MGTYHSEKEALLAFYAYWEKLHPGLEDFHQRWLLKNGEIIPMTKGQIVSAVPHGQQALYIVLAGLLAKERYCTDRREKLIMTLAVPHMGFFTTMHFFSKSPALGDIVCLRSGFVLKIPYKAIRPHRDQEKAIETLVNLIINKKKSQLDHLRVLSTLPNITSRYFYFADHLSPLYAMLNQSEQARLLLISERSIQRAKRLYVRRR